MYFLSPLLFSSALAAAKATDENTPIPEFLDTTPTASTPSTASTKTVFITVTRTLYPTPLYPPPTAKTLPHFAFPPLFTHKGHLGARLSTDDAAWPMFTLATATATSAPFEGHYTPPTTSSMQWHCSYLSTPSSLSSALTISPSVGNSQIRSNAGYAPDPTMPTEVKETAHVIPLPSGSEDTFNMLPIPCDSGVVDIPPVPTQEATATPPVPTGSSDTGPTPPLPSSRPTHSSSPPFPPSDSATPGFNWPTTAPATNTTSNNSADKTEASNSEPVWSGPASPLTNATESSSMTNGTAWSGIDNAIPGQVHDPPLHERALPWLSPPPPLQSTSAAVKRIQGVWGVFRRDCTPCKGEGRVIC
ncbi:uncharacterized protein M421DRAFT_2416 [Didymella exigua CBS 183.55]|uniref:Uncharacterized protein n=1 Tax=Didymella exigua CBS 183.55 TaxID=1150837 RepID=A0A6A5RTH0_9PLEO|nr:uncharacterized protein M421DRAFT_2416 [Didymella exigua CBS 183.55]KAF1931785.1 hypothetical protein M421DRAFT_2416 [Didymella exigua CBS 183.55]